MKKLSYVIILFILSIFSYNVSGQYIFGIDEYIEYANIERTNDLESTTYKDVQGNPFLVDDFVTGQVKLKDGKTYQGPLRYDMYSGNLEFKAKDDQIYTVLNPENIESVVINEYELIYIQEDKLRKRGSFYEKLSDGDFSLVAELKVILKDPEAARPYVAAKPARFLPKDKEFFLYNSDQGLIKIKNKKDLLAVDESRAGEIAAFVKKNKIKPANQESLIKFTEFLNSPD